MGLEKRQGYWLWTDGPVPPGSAGITFGKLVVLRGRTTPARLLRHELVHVAQYRRQGFARFLTSYVWQYARWRFRGYPHRGAYRRIPQEIEAYWLERQPGQEHDRPDTPLG